MPNVHPISGDTSVCCENNDVVIRKKTDTKIDFEGIVDLKIFSVSHLYAVTRPTTM
tara:strand:+ start:813 stop:980 length:168 start_codon:yes stop_codon:yes gene_type:complete